MMIISGSRVDNRAIAFDCVRTHRLAQHCPEYLFNFLSIQ